MLHCFSSLRLLCYHLLFQTTAPCQLKNVSSLKTDKTHKHDLCSVICCPPQPHAHLTHLIVPAPATSSFFPFYSPCFPTCCDLCPECSSSIPSSQSSLAPAFQTLAQTSLPDPDSLIWQRPHSRLSWRHEPVCQGPVTVIVFHVLCDYLIYSKLGRGWVGSMSDFAHSCILMQDSHEVRK